MQKKKVFTYLAIFLLTLSFLSVSIHAQETESLEELEKEFPNAVEKAQAAEIQALKEEGERLEEEIEEMG